MITSPMMGMIEVIEDTSVSEGGSSYSFTEVVDNEDHKEVTSFDEVDIPTEDDINSLVEFFSGSDIDLNSNKFHLNDNEIKKNITAVPSTSLLVDLSRDDYEIEYLGNHSSYLIHRSYYRTSCDQTSEDLSPLCKSSIPDNIYCQEIFSNVTVSINSTQAEKEKSPPFNASFQPVEPVLESLKKDDLDLLQAPFSGDLKRCESQSQEWEKSYDVSGIDYNTSIERNDASRDGSTSEKGTREKTPIDWLDEGSCSNVCTPSPDTEKLLLDDEPNEKELTTEYKSSFSDAEFAKGEGENSLSKKCISDDGGQELKYVLSVLRTKFCKPDSAVDQLKSLNSEENSTNFEPNSAVDQLKPLKPKEDFTNFGICKPSVFSSESEEDRCQGALNIGDDQACKTALSDTQLPEIVLICDEVSSDKATRSDRGASCINNNTGKAISLSEAANQPIKYVPVLNKDYDQPAKDVRVLDSGVAPAHKANTHSSTINGETSGASLDDEIKLSEAAVASHGLIADLSSSGSKKSCLLTPIVNRETTTQDSSQELATAAGSSAVLENSSILEEGSSCSQLKSVIVLANDSSSGNLSHLPRSHHDEPWVSNDASENADNFDPEWEYLRNLTTDEERYIELRKRWKNLSIPDPRKNLSVQNYRKSRQDQNYSPSQHGNDEKDSRKRTRSVMEGNNNLPPAKRQRTQVYSAQIHTIQCQISKESRQVEVDKQRALEMLRRKYQSKIAQVNYTHDSQRVRQFKLQKLHHDHNMEKKNLIRKFDCRAQTIQTSKVLKLESLKRAKEEVYAFNKFYHNLHNNNAGTIDQVDLTDEEVKCFEEIEQMYDVYDKFYCG